MSLPHTIVGIARQCPAAPCVTVVIYATSRAHLHALAKLSLLPSQVGRSKIVFFDEPTTGLDPASRKRVHAILEAAKQQRAVILTVRRLAAWADFLPYLTPFEGLLPTRCVGGVLAFVHVH